jgi:cellulose synthase/poly-beta-1,6-N-acetylglucosamine synthase-like glycosyltransferase
MDWASLGRDSFLLIYTISLLIVSIYGAHRYIIIFLYYRNRHRIPEPKGHFDTLPSVTIQLPIYNERLVARRVIEKTCQIDYPVDLLTIQVLNDSTDPETTAIIKDAVAQAHQAGVDIHYLDRPNRIGFKAGNLANGLREVTSEFVTIFDADFVPQPDILMRSVHFFTDPKVAVVQSRWEHLNRADSLLTESQAILLDGHFGVEQVARNRSSRFITFNGTAGTWRVEAIRKAGGWHFDTLTEDLDLSFRAQMQGWEFVYLPDLTSPAELPAGMMGFKRQQFRWTKGGIQTAMKLWPRVMLSKQPLKIKIESFFHLTAYMIHLYMFVLIVLMFPAMMMRAGVSGEGSIGRSAIDLTVLVLVTMSGSVFYMAGQIETRRGWFGKLKYLPMLMALGVGLSVSNVRAVVEAIFGRSSDFVATPKLGDAGGADRRDVLTANARSDRDWLPYAEFGMGLYMLACCGWVLFAFREAIQAVSFLVTFAFGFFWVSLMSFREQYASSHASQKVDVPVEVGVREN